MKPTIIAVLIFTVFNTSTALAAVYSGASLSNYTVSLIDLDLNDGIAPSISFQQGNDVIYTFVSGISTPEDLNDVNSQNIAPVSYTSTNGVNTTTASIAGSSISNFDMSVSGNSQFAVPNIGGYGYFSSVSNTIFFTLSPNTSVNFSLNSLNYIYTTEGTGSNADALSNSYLDVRGYNVVDNNIINFNSDFDSKGFELTKFDFGVDFTAQELSILSVTLGNNFNNPLTGFLFSGASINGTAYSQQLSTVPVPAAMPLLASVMGIFGVGYIRRKT